MQRLRQMQLLQLKQQQQQIKLSYNNAFDDLLLNQQTKILIQYCKEQLKNIDVSKIQNINEYSTVNISRLIFSKQLSSIRQQLQKLPNCKCPLDIFLVIMLKVVKFPFQKTPLYLLGLKQMFRQIKQDECQEYVSYEKIEKYVMGEIVNLNDEKKLETQFQIQFSQNKMQDFLMHDNGVKKIQYSQDLKKYMVLDWGSKIIKIYDQKIKIVGRFQPNKQKHNKKQPTILTFDYNQLGSKLGISLGDSTFSIINLKSFLQTPSQQGFRSVLINEVSYPSKALITKIFYLSMMNKWLCIDQTGEIWIYDVQKYKEQTQNYCKPFKHPNNDYQVRQVLEIVSLAAVALVIKNQVWFYNQVLSKTKFKKFAHSEQIVKFVYSEESNQFFYVGKQERFVTIFTINKTSGQPSKIWTFQTNQVVVDFGVFTFYDSLLILDSKHNLKVYSMSSSVLQYQQNYQSIVKRKEVPIRLVKNSKNQFLIHATYILVMQLGKVAIDRDMEFSFLDTFYYDSAREQMFYSVNGQVIGLSLMHGQIRRSLASQNSNLDKHKAFHMGRGTQLFLVDEDDNLFQVYDKNDPRYRENKDHRKQVGITHSKKTFYDQQHRMTLMMSQSQIYIVRNDSQNNFTLKSCLLLQNFPQFIKRKYCPTSKELLLLDSSNCIHLMRSYDFTITKMLRVEVFKQQNQGQKTIVDAEYQDQLGVLMILTNNAQFALINLKDLSRNIYIRLRDILPYKLQSVAFPSFSYQKSQKDKRHKYSSRVFFYSQTGWMIQLQVDRLLWRVVEREQYVQKCIHITYIKDTHQLDYSKLLSKVPVQHFKLPKSNHYKPQVPKQANFIKVHDRQIVFSRRIVLQGYQLLTIGADGHIKLWGQDRKVYFDLKLPLLIHIEWNMNQLHERRNQRIVDQTQEFLQTVTERMKKNQRQALQMHYYKRKLKNKSLNIKIDFDNPITIQFQNKDLEQIVMNRKQFEFQNMTLDVSPRRRGNSNVNKRMNLTQRNTQPWKMKKQFQQIYQKASHVDKYVPQFKQKMPFDLLLMRNDLHIGESLVLEKIKNRPKQEKLIILPQLKNYFRNIQAQSQNKTARVNAQKKTLEDIYKTEEQNKFESCLFVKTERGPKKANAFDQIDKYFQRKEQELLNKRWIPNKRNLMKKNFTVQPKTENSSFSHSNQAGKTDPLKSVLRIFQEHNKEALSNKKGRIINIPFTERSSRKGNRRKVAS